MDEVVRIAVGEVRLTRVPYFDIPLGAAVVGLTPEIVGAVPDATPMWATSAGEVIVGQAVWAVESAGHVIVVDPCGAADDFIRTGPDAVAHQDRVFTAMAEAGIARERVDTVVLTHLDGIGMAAAVDGDGAWLPAFPAARVLMTQAELDHRVTAPASGSPALRALIEHGVVDSVDASHAITPEVTLELTGAHTPGHAIVRVASGGEQAVMLGHLAVSPLHLATGRCEVMHEDPDRALSVLGELVSRSVADGAIMIGPLWPWPGAVRVDAQRRVVPVEVHVAQ